MTKPLVNRSWRPEALKEMTEARVAMGRVGAGVPTKAGQAFLLDHARAREAVWSGLDAALLHQELVELGTEPVEVQSEAPDRNVYIRRPDLGRRLSADSAMTLAASMKGRDVVVIVGDGLSAAAIERNAAGLLRLLLPELNRLGISWGNVVIAQQARVALGDPIAEAVAAKTSIMLIGERPGLSAADSLGVYITHLPRTGTADSSRNCISNIRDGGLSAQAACDLIVSTLIEMRRTGLSGVAMKNVLTPTNRHVEIDR